jgi:hypothetical protein
MGKDKEEKKAKKKAKKKELKQLRKYVSPQQRLAIAQQAASDKSGSYYSGMNRFVQPTNKTMRNGALLPFTPPAQFTSYDRMPTSYSAMQGQAYQSGMEQSREQWKAQQLVGNLSNLAEGIKAKDALNTQVGRDKAQQLLELMQLVEKRNTDSNLETTKLIKQVLYNNPVAHKSFSQRIADSQTLRGVKSINWTPSQRKEAQGHLLDSLNDPHAAARKSVADSVPNSAPSQEHPLDLDFDDSLIRGLNNAPAHPAALAINAPIILNTKHEVFVHESWTMIKVSLCATF